MSYILEALKELNTMKLLTEDIESVKRQYSHVPEEDFDKIIRLDPTFNPNRDSVGKYGKWLLGLYKKDNPLKWDKDNLTELIADYDKKKKDRTVSIEKDINKFKSIKDMFDAIQNSGEAELSHRQKVRQNQKARHGVNLGTDADLVFEDSEWEVLVPKTYAASCKLGQGTSWCTATTEIDNYYKYYTEEGPLYIIINKQHPEEKYQFHFESGQYMDRNDRSINLFKFFSTYENLKNFFWPKFMKLMEAEDLPDIPFDSEVTAVFNGDDIYILFRDTPSSDLDAEFIQTLVENPYDAFDFIGYAPSEKEWIDYYIDFSDESLINEFIRIGILDETDRGEPVKDIKETFRDNYFDNKDDFSEVYGCFYRAFGNAQQDAAIEDATNEIIGALENIFKEAYISYEGDENALVIKDIYANLLSSVTTFDDIYACFGDMIKDMMVYVVSNNFRFREPYYGFGDSVDTDLVNENFLEEITCYYQ